jgi:MoaA/NifB/PqqE/SkfB family radical SAM enzyme
LRVADDERLLITEDNVEQLLKADVITVSIDSLAKEAYESRRGVPGGLAKALQGLERLLVHNRRTYIVVQAVLDEENWREVPRLSEYFYRLGVDTVYQPVYRHFFEIPPAEWQALTRQLKFKRRLTGWLFRPFLRRLPEVANGRAAVPCLAGSFAFVVDHRGHLKACHLDETCKVDLRSTRLREAWRALAGRRRQLAGPERGCLCGDTAYVPYAMALGRWRGSEGRRVGAASALRWER